VALTSKKTVSSGNAVIGAVGAGNFGRTMILPLLNELKQARLSMLVTSRGVSAEGSGRKFGFERASTDVEHLLRDASTNAVVITTPHATHAGLVMKFLAAGKNVFVEKPLALSYEELSNVVEARNNSDAFFTVGFNRRFAPYVQDARKFMQTKQGRSVVSIRVNAGQLPAESWQRDADEGNGRILGELCHFVDLAMHLVGSQIKQISATSASAERGICEDVSTSISFADGSLATIVYTALGDTGFSKELIECYKGGAVCSIEDFRKLLIVSDGKIAIKKSSLSQDKGHKAQIDAFVSDVISGTPTVDEQSLIDSSAATLAVLDSLRLGRPIFMSDITQRAV
jgi:predicted dehydrogenase